MGSHFANLDDQRLWTDLLIGNVLHHRFLIALDIARAVGQDLRGGIADQVRGCVFFLLLSVACDDPTRRQQRQHQDTSTPHGSSLLHCLAQAVILSVWSNISRV